MSFKVQNSSQFKIVELAIISKQVKLDISSIFEELNIFDSILMPVMSGNIMIRDSVGLTGKFIFDGSESLLIHIVKDENSETGVFKKSFRIYKQTNRKNENLTSEVYLLHFVSDELILSEQRKVNQSYEGTYSSIAYKILRDYLKVSEVNLKGNYEDSVGVRKVVIPNMSPLEAVQWCAKRSVDSQNIPNFMFFQNILGFNYVTLSSMLSNGEIIDIKVELKNVTDNYVGEMSGVKNFEVLSQYDEIDRIKSGVNSAKFIGFDPITKVIDEKKITYGNLFNRMKHGNENPLISYLQNKDGTNNVESYDSRKTLSVFGLSRKYSNYIKKYEPESINKEDNIESYLTERRSVVKNLLNKRVKATMPGNFQLSSGLNVNLNVPNFSIKEKGQDELDESLNGKYLIIATRHIIGFEKHETVVELATTSTNSPINSTNPKQFQDIENY
jgi:hypothetical protein